MAEPTMDLRPRNTVADEEGPRTMSAGKITGRGRSLMKILTETSILIIKRDVEEMTAEEAREVWGHLEPFFPGVCARASARKRDTGWLALVAKMDLIRRRAQEAEA